MGRILCLLAIVFAAVWSGPVQAAEPAEPSPVTVKVDKLFQVTAPDASWAPVKQGLPDLQSPRAALFLIHQQPPAMFRFHVYPSDQVVAKEMIDACVNDLNRAGFDVTVTPLLGSPHGAVVAEFHQPPDKVKSKREMRGMILAERLPGNPQRTILVIGLWTEDAQDFGKASFDGITGSLKALPAEKKE